MLGWYGRALFVGLPFCLGLVAAWLRAPGSLSQALGTASAATVLAGVLIVAVALDGAICIVMALPLCLPLSLRSARFIGYAIQRGRRGSAVLPPAGSVALALPGSWASRRSGSRGRR